MSKIIGPGGMILYPTDRSPLETSEDAPLIACSPDDEGLNWTEAFSRLKKFILGIVIFCIGAFPKILRYNFLDIFLGACIVASIAWLYYPIQWIYKGKALWLIVVTACIIALIIIIETVGILYLWVAVPLGLAWPIRWIYRGLRKN